MRGRLQGEVVPGVLLGRLGALGGHPGLGGRGGLGVDGEVDLPHHTIYVSRSYERNLAELRAAVGPVQDVAKTPACEPVQSLRCQLESLDRVGPRSLTPGT